MTALDYIDFCDAYLSARAEIPNDLDQQHFAWSTIMALAIRLGRSLDGQVLLAEALAAAIESERATRPGLEGTS